MKILLADDHEMVRDGLKPVLRRVADDVEVVEASTLAEAKDLARREAPQLAILDLKMPGMNGLAGLDLFRSEFPAIPLVILSGMAGSAEITACMSRGAAGFIPKTMGAAGILNALRLVLCGVRFVPEEGLGGPITRTAADSPLGELTEAERAVLVRVVAGQSNKEVAREIGVQEITVKKRLSSIYRKLNVSNRTELTRLAVNLGL